MWGLKLFEEQGTVWDDCFRTTSPLRGLKLKHFTRFFNGVNFRIISPLRGLKRTMNIRHFQVEYTLELFPHCGGRRNADSLLCKDIDLCVNSTPHYLRPPMRGHQNNISLLHKTRYLCVNGTPYHLRSLLWAVSSLANLNQKRTTSNITGWFFLYV